MSDREAKKVLDASALLALLGDEPGSLEVKNTIETGAVIGTVNYAEVVTKLRDSGIPKETVHDILSYLPLEVLQFDVNQALLAGELRLLTKDSGLSLGDRACLALAIQLNLPVLTADRQWKSLRLPINIEIIRIPRTPPE